MSNACRSCRAPVEWARTAKGNLIPLDVGTSSDGNLVVDNGVARIWTRGSALPRRRSHFASCVHANAWRRPR